MAANAKKNPKNKRKNSARRKTVIVSVPPCENKGSNIPKTTQTKPYGYIANTKRTGDRVANTDNKVHKIYIEMYNEFYNQEAIDTENAIAGLERYLSAQKK